MDEHDQVPGAGGWTAEGGSEGARRLYIRILSDLPAARAYLERVKARATSPFSAYVTVPVQGREGYVEDKVKIKLRRNREGAFDRITVVPKNADLEPTPEELEAILRSARNARWPELKYLNSVPKNDRVPAAIRDAKPEDLFLFRDPGKGNGFSYVQVRHPGVDGPGKYTSWIALDNEEWTPGQPDILPLFGAEELNEATFRVVIHEGPKAAAEVIRKLQEAHLRPQKHPWFEELSGVQLGWPGGGNRYQRVNWSVLDVCGQDTEILVVGDNDDVGRTAADRIAESYLRRFKNVRIVRFPEAYPLGFDLGDEWPQAAPALRAFMARPRYLGNAAELEVEIPVREVALRLGEQGLAFNIGGKAVVVDRLTSTNGGKFLRSKVAEPETLRIAVDKVSLWEKWVERASEMQRVKLPGWVLQQVVLNSDLLPPLHGLVDHPVISRGRMLSGDAGYDLESGLYISGPKIEAQEHGSAEEAFRFLSEDWLGRFPFASEQDRVRAIAVALTLLLRRTEIRGGAPMAFITAPGPQTGKSMLAKALCTAVLGRMPPPMVYAKVEEEFKKAFMSVLMESAPVVYYDNVPNGWSVGNQELDVYATSDEYSDRVLGKSERISVPALSFLLFAGNNISPKDDTRTRSFEIRLERKEGMDLKGALEWTEANRGAILGALLAVSLHPPVPPKTASRFPEWERRVAGPLLALSGDNDVLAEVAEAADDNESAWYAEELGSVMVHIRRLQLQHGGPVRSQILYADERCREALGMLLGTREKGNDFRVPYVGIVLKRHRDRTVNGMTLRISQAWDAKNSKKSTAYSVEGDPIEEDEGYVPM